jgi:hypothetical protein
MDKVWENDEILNTMREFIEKASKREAVCECNYDIASEDWFSYIEDKYNKTLSDYEQEMLNDKFTEERNRYPKRIER